VDRQDQCQWNGEGLGDCWKMFDAGKTRIIGLPYGEKKL